MGLAGRIGIPDGFVFQYENLTGLGRVTEQDLQELAPAMERAAAAVRSLSAAGYAPGHLSKDGAPEPVYFPRQARLAAGNPNDEASVLRLEQIGQEWKDRVDVAVFIGIGGSYLGDKVMFDLAARPYWNELPAAARNGYPAVYFAGNNVDSVTLQGLMDNLALQAESAKRPLSVQLIPISKSGTTMEPLTAFAVLLQYLQARKDRFKTEVLAVTGPNPEQSLLYRLARENKWPVLEIPEGIGGRFCILSNPGLLMGAVLGYDIRALLAGARDMAELCEKTEDRENPALLNAALKFLAAKKLGADTEVFMGYGDQLAAVGSWYVQLLAESLGKRSSRRGETVHYGRTPIVAVGTTDMHSMTQQHQDGARNKVVQFLQVEKPAVALRVENPFADAAAFALYGNKDLHRLLQAALEANETALTEDGRLNARYILPALTPRYVGQLLMFLMFSIAYEGELADVDAYDQPGVEAYKRLMKAALAKE